MTDECQQLRNEAITVIALQKREVSSLMNYPMRSDLKVGAKFPDFELPDHSGNHKKLSHLLRNMPGVLVFSRGYF